MSDTPKTDAHIESRFTTWDSRTVDADFARDLERENAKLRAELEAEKADHADSKKQWNEALDVGLKLVEQHDALRAELEAARECIGVFRMREDKALLDALDRNAVVRERTLAIMERGADHEPIRWAGIEWDGREVGVREAIRLRVAAEGKTAK